MPQEVFKGVALVVGLFLVNVAAPELDGARDVAGFAFGQAERPCGLAGLARACRSPWRFQAPQRLFPGGRPECAVPGPGWC